MARTNSDVPRRLVIVESPAKAKTIAGFLGDRYVVESSFGHIRDLPSKKTEVPAAQRDRFGAPSASMSSTASSRCTWFRPDAPRTRCAS